MSPPDAAFSQEETRRVARLARLALTPDEEARLARELSDIARAFGELAASAETLTVPADAPPGAARADDVAPAPAAQADAILAQAPRVDAATRLVRASRGTVG